jgi:hypothetical protein
MKKKYTREGTFIGKYVEFTRLLLTYLNHFPKYEKYGLCQQIRNVNYDIYILMIECHKRYYKKSTLTQIDIKHEQLRMMIYLAYEIGYFKFKTNNIDDNNNIIEVEGKRYMNITSKIDELGRIIGSMINNLKENGEW